MIDRAHDLPIAKQAGALNISRGSVYYLPRQLKLDLPPQPPPRITAPGKAVRVPANAV